MIVDRDTSRKADRVMTLGGDEVHEGVGTFTETTMAMRAIVPVVPLSPLYNSGGNGGDYKPWPMPDDDGEGDEITPPPYVDYEALERRALEADKGGDEDPGRVPKPDPMPDPGRLPKPGRVVGESVKNWKGPFPIRRNYSLGAIREDAERGVEHETGTFALAAIQRQTGAPSKNEMAHRTAQRIQNAFTSAGWDLAVWYGEYTEEFWVMDSEGLYGFTDVTSMYQGMGWQSL